MRHKTLGVWLLLALSYLLYLSDLQLGYIIGKDIELAFKWCITLYDGWIRLSMYSQTNIYRQLVKYFDKRAFSWSSWIFSNQFSQLCTP